MAKSDLDFCLPALFTGNAPVDSIKTLTDKQALPPFFRLWIVTRG